MTFNVSNLAALIGRVAVQNRQGDREVGLEKLYEQKDEQRELRTEIEQFERNADAIVEDLDGLNERSDIEKAWHGFWGSDRTGGVVRDQQENQAALQQAEQRTQLVVEDQQETFSVLSAGEDAIDQAEQALQEIVDDQRAAAAVFQEG